MIQLTRYELANELRSNISGAEFEAICDAYYTQFLTQEIIDKLSKHVKYDILKDTKTIYAMAGVHHVALNLMATSINRLIDRKLVKQAGDIASVEFAVNVAKAGLVYIAETLEDNAHAISRH